MKRINVPDVAALVNSLILLNITINYKDCQFTLQYTSPVHLDVQQVWLFLKPGETGVIFAYHEINYSHSEFVVKRKNIQNPFVLLRGCSLMREEVPSTPDQSEEEETGQVAGEDLRESRAARHSRR